MKRLAAIALIAGWPLCAWGQIQTAARADTSTTGSTARGASAEDIRFTAADSLLFTLGSRRIARLYGNAKVEHTKGTLTAGTIELDLGETTMSATTAVPGDTLTEPVLQRGKDQIRSRSVKYNYTTDKGKFDVTRVSIDQGAVRGEEVKRAAPHVVFIKDGRYSTCELDHPHFYIRASRMKIVDEEEVFFTNARLFILDIPYPIPFPVGYIPSGFDKQRSGLLAPTYAFQDQNGRGIGLQGFGWFQYINDHVATTVSGDLFTSGTFYLSNRTEYNWTQQTRGSFGYSYSRDQGMEPTDPDFTRNIQQQLTWQHSQTLNPYSTLNMDINLRTSKFFQQNSYNVNDRAQTSTTSRIGYNYRDPEGLFNVGTSLSQSQNFSNNSVTVAGPSVNFGMRRLTPFAGGVRRANAPFYETLSLGYNNRINSQFQFTPLQNANPDITWLDALFSPSKYRDVTGNRDHIRYGMQHNLDGTIQLLSGNRANVNATGRMTEYWYGETIRKELNTTTNRLDERRVREFSSTRDFGASITLNSTIYGISTRALGPYEGFRHTVRPSISYTWRPDFSTRSWGIYRTVQSDTSGRTQRYSIYEKGIFGGPGAGRQNVIGLNIGNVFETKRVRRDSTGEKSEQIVRLIDNLSLNTSYNLAADAFKLSDLNANISSSVIRNLNLSANANFTFYQFDSLGRRVDQYRWDAGRSPVRLQRFSMQFGSQFQQGEQGGISVRGAPSHFPETYDPLDQTDFRNIDPGFSSYPIEPLRVAWSVSLSFNYSWEWVTDTERRRAAVLNAQSVQVRLAREWQAGTSIGYDFIERRLTPSQFNVTRQLHCWNMSFVWDPFGATPYYLFRLTVNSAQMQGIFQKLPGLNNLERSSSPINRFGTYGF